MASTQLSPGVVVLEKDLTTVASATIDNVASVVGSFDGNIHKGGTDIFALKLDTNGNKVWSKQFGTSGALF